MVGDDINATAVLGEFRVSSSEISRLSEAQGETQGAGAPAPRALPRLPAQPYLSSMPSRTDMMPMIPSAAEKKAAAAQRQLQEHFEQEIATLEADKQAAHLPVQHALWHVHREIGAVEY